MSFTERCNALESRLNALEAREHFSPDEIERAVADEVRSRVFKIGTTLGIVNVVALVAGLWYVFTVLPQNAADLAIKRNAPQMNKLQVDIIELGKEIANHETEAARLDDRLLELDERVLVEESAVQQLTQHVEARGTAIETRITDLLNNLESTEFSLSVQIAEQCTRMESLTQEIASFEQLVDRFKDERGGELLVSRIDRFSEFLESNEGVDLIDEIQHQIVDLQAGNFDHINCATLNVGNGVWIGADDAGYGYLEIVGPMGEDLILLGPDGFGHGVISLYEHVAPAISSLSVEIGTEVGGFVRTFSDGNSLVSIGGAPGGGGIDFYTRQFLSAHPVQASLGVDEGGRAKLMIFNNLGHLQAGLGAGTSGDGFLVINDKRGKPGSVLDGSGLVGVYGGESRHALTAALGVDDKGNGAIVTRYVDGELLCYFGIAPGGSLAEGCNRK